MERARVAWGDGRTRPEAIDYRHGRLVDRAPESGSGVWTACFAVVGRGLRGERRKDEIMDMAEGEWDDSNGMWSADVWAELGWRRKWAVAEAEGGSDAPRQPAN